MHLASVHRDCPRAALAGTALAGTLAAQRASEVSFLAGKLCTFDLGIFFCTYLCTISSVVE